MSQRQVPWLVRVLYTHNPFYLISACLFVYGLKLMFRVGDSSVLFRQGGVGYMQPWNLMASLAAVTILMAVTAILVVRLGKVWEDARSLVLIVLLMFLAIAVSFDELINVASDADNMLTQVACLFGFGTLLSLGTAEALIRGLRLRIPWAYRLPLYTFIMLFFVWPSLLLPGLIPLTPIQVRMLIVAFPLAAAIVTLTLIPAVRMGTSIMADNGTPWKWPWLPWTPFVFLWAAVCFRSYSLTISFDTPLQSGHFWDSAFGVYQLVPLFAAIAVVILEIAVVQQNIRLQNSVLLLSPLLLITACPWVAPWHRLPTYSSFAVYVTDTIGSPVFLTLMILLTLAVWAIWRGVKNGRVLLDTLLLLAIFVGPTAFRSATSSVFQNSAAWWPLAVFATIQCVTGWRTSSTWRMFTGLAAAAVLPLMLVKNSGGGGVSEWRMFATLHVMLLPAMIAGLFAKNGVAEFLRRCSAVQWSGTMLLGILLLVNRQTSALVVLGYAGLLTAAMPLIGRLLKERLFLVLATMHCGAAFTVGCVACVIALFTAQLPSGVRQVLFAGLSFLAAVLISILKSGTARRIRVSWLLWRRRSRIVPDHRASAMHPT